MKTNRMNRISFAISLAWLLASAIPLLGQSHPGVGVPRVPQITVPSSRGAPASQSIPVNTVSNADISAGIKRHIAIERKNSADKRSEERRVGKECRPAWDRYEVRA